MAPEDIERKVKSTIADRLGVPESDIQPTSALVEDLGADSLDLVELVMAMEEEFEVEIPDDQVEKLKTVQDAVSYITARAA
jgi:acyl carrier protein